MVKLYEAQENALKDLKEKLLKNKMAFLTAEVGAGKTYIAAKLAEEFNGSVLIVSPSHVVEHWTNVLGDLIEKVTLVDNKKKIDYTNFDLVIYDEVHEIKNVKGKLENFNGLFLGLTGTIIAKNLYGIATLMNCFSDVSKNMMSYNNWKKYNLRTNSDARALYVQAYISIQYCTKLSRASSNDFEFKVNTRFAKLTMNQEERAFYNFITKRLSSLDAKNRTEKYLNEYLDKTKNNELVTIKNEEYFIGFKLAGSNDIKLEKLTEELKDKTSYLVYTFNDALSKRLAENIENLYFGTTVEEINQLLENSKNVVVNISNFLTGVSFSSSNIIWYQTPTTVAEDEQGVGRICRLNSEKTEKNVIYFGFDNTIQENMVEVLMRNHALNKSSTKNEDLPFLKFHN